MSTPVSRVSLKSSLITEVVIMLPTCWSAVLFLLVAITSLPVQFVCQESHKIGPNPVWGSTIPVLARLFKVSA